MWIPFVWKTLKRSTHLQLNRAFKQKRLNQVGNTSFNCGACSLNTIQFVDVGRDVPETFKDDDGQISIPVDLGGELRVGGYIGTY